MGETKRMLRYRLWNSDDVGAGHVTVDPLFVAAVVERVQRQAYGGVTDVAVIRMTDGKEYVVCDGSRQVATEIWLGKSITT